MNWFFLIIYFIRIILFGVATGTLFINLNLFNKMSRGQVMLVGISASPLFVSLIDFLLGLVFVGWGSWLFFLFPVIASVVELLINCNYKVAAGAIKSILCYCHKFIKDLGNWTIVSLLLVAAAISPFVYLCVENKLIDHSGEGWVDLKNNNVWLMLVLFVGAATIIAFICKRSRCAETLRKSAFLIALLIVLGANLVHSMLMIQYPVVDSDRSHYQLEARYFAEDKNSWQIDNYSDEKDGSSLRDDHGPLWVVYLADGYLTSDFTEQNEPLMYVNIAIQWTYLCLLVLLLLSATFLCGDYKAGIITLILFHIYKYTVLMQMGSRDAFRFLGLLMLMLFVANLLETVERGEAKWYEYLFLVLFCYLSMNGHEGNVYIMLGLFSVVTIYLLMVKTPIKQWIAFCSSTLVGTLLGITKTIEMYLTTGRLTSNTGQVFHDTAVIERARQVNQNRADIQTIWDTYTIPVRIMMLLGIAGLIVLIIYSFKSTKKDKNSYIAALLISGMLLPMTGIMDWIGYDVNFWFFEQVRYRMYFLMLLSITGAWLLTRETKFTWMRIITSTVCISVFLLFLQSEAVKLSAYNKGYVETCKETVQSYEILADEISEVTEGDAFTQDQVLLYYLHGTPKLLYHMYSEDLIQAKTDDEVEKAMKKLNVGAILLPEDGVSYHDYSLLPFWDYINSSENFTKINPDERTDNCDEVIFAYNKQKEMLNNYEK